MKKSLFTGFIALAALTMTSCSNDENMVSIPQGNAIEFGTYVGRDAQTRGSVLNNEVATGLPEQGFGVFAYYTDNTDYNASSSPANFMNNTHVTSNDGTTWTYSPVKYWPNEETDKLSFFAYAPHGPYTVATTGDPILDFTVNSDPTFHVDLVVADASEKKNLTKQYTTETVQFNFKHVLSRVGFKVEAVVDDVNNQVNGAEDTDNQYNIGIDGNTTISVQEVELIGTFNTAGKINLNTSLWDNTQMTTEATSYSLAATDFNDVASNVQITKDQLNKSSEYMMLIPTASPTGVQIRVKYTVTTQDVQLASGYSVVTNNITSDAFNFKFEQGKAYNFVLHLGLTSVKLSASVSGWEETDHVVNVPLNEM